MGVSPWLNAKAKMDTILSIGPRVWARGNLFVLIFRNDTNYIYSFYGGAIKQNTFERSLGHRAIMILFDKCSKPFALLYGDYSIWTGNVTFIVFIAPAGVNPKLYRVI